MNSLNLAAGGSREGWRGVGSVKERGGEGQTGRGFRCGGCCRSLAGTAGWVEGPREKGDCSISSFQPLSEQLGSPSLLFSFEAVKNQGAFPMGTEVTFILSPPFPTSVS